MFLLLPAVAARAEHPDLDGAREAVRAGSMAECIALLEPALADYRQLGAGGGISAEDLDLMGACHEALGDLPRAFHAYGRAAHKDRLESSDEQHADAVAQRRDPSADEAYSRFRAAVMERDFEAARAALAEPSARLRTAACIGWARPT